ncbi:MAG TPA: hypothetical protein PLB87_11700, partial [Prolixibacteraceae bacterium]|nr:hypothetical protein [Prolixibacteraceae bacterium]
MATSPGTNSSHLVTFKVYSEGSPVGDQFEFKSITVTKEVNRIGSATLEILAGDMPNKDFPGSNDDTFKPGKSIKIEAGYDETNEQIYEGIIVSHGLRLPSGGDNLMVIECRDFAVKSTYGRKNAIYEKMKDNEVIQKVAGNYSDLTVSVDATTYKHEELVQYYSTDWDFMLSRAEVNGLIAISDDKKLSVIKPKVSESAVLTVTFGVDIIDFDGEVSVYDQYSAVQAVAWDAATQAVVTTNGSAPSLNAQGNLSQTDLSAVIGP